MTDDETENLETLARIKALHDAVRRAADELDLAKEEVKRCKETLELATLDRDGYLHGLTVPLPLFDREAPVTDFAGPTTTVTLNGKDMATVGEIARTPGNAPSVPQDATTRPGPGETAAGDGDATTGTPGGLRRKGVAGGA